MKAVIFIIFILFDIITNANNISDDKFKKTVVIKMKDGINLSTDIYFPEDLTQEVPLLLIRTNINKNSIGFLPYYFTSNGYAVAVQDVRGRFESEGLWEPYVYEAEDGYETIEWFAEQDWCNGKIGMMGGSYSAVIQLLTAKIKPPHLSAVIPHNLPADPFRNAPYENGILLLAPEMWWVNLIESSIKDYNDPVAIRESQKVKDDTSLYSLPVNKIDEKIIGREISYWQKWLEHNTNDNYWQSISYQESLSNLDIPILLFSGWYDTHSIGTKLAWEELSKSNNKKVKMIIGPWNHSNAVPRYPSTKNVGAEAYLDILNIFLKWFDRYLKNADNEISSEPKTMLYVMNNSSWIESNTYPLENTNYTPIYLSSNKGANSLLGDGKLLCNSSDQRKEYDEYIYNPADPTPAFLYRNSQGRKKSDEITSSRNDILVFESAPLDTEMTVLGPITAKLFASSSSLDTDWFINFYAINEKDEYMPLTHGCIRARFRNSFTEPELLERNKIYEYNIDLWQTGIKLDRGWKIRLEISSADFPQYSRNLNTGKNNEMETEYEIATQRIYHSVKYPSCIILPVITNN
ncbi:MAG: CocE/NonD family hydrolase [Ignavibacterium sp.]|nr:CocE/NonD family hydrolase [Ignavibacterium sp.]